jgi:hypothetical protein
VCFLATPVFADMMIQLYDNSGYGSPYGTNGGALRVVVASGSEKIGIYEAGDEFNTFCLELNEGVGFSVSEENTFKTYFVTLNTGAINGGNGGQTATNFDPLSQESMGLYNNWLNETSPTPQFAIDTQKAIWAWENEVTYDSLTNDAKTLYDNASGFSPSNAMVMNLWTDKNGDIYSGLAQDVMVSVAPVPVPGAFLLGSMGLGFATWRLKKRKMA